MKLLRKHLLPNDGNIDIDTDPLTEAPSGSLPRIEAVRLGKKFDAAVGALVAVVAASGWLYLITISVRAFAGWI
jgi:hypothetical protein